MHLPKAKALVMAAGRAALEAQSLGINIINRYLLGYIGIVLQAIPFLSQSHICHHSSQQKELHQATAVLEASTSCPAPASVIGDRTTDGNCEFSWAKTLSPAARTLPIILLNSGV
jgi:hypothetical protein